MIDWFWSDQHFGHQAIRKHCNRPHSSLQHMHVVMIANFAQRVQPTDVVCWVGDVMLYEDPDCMRARLEKMPGRHILVRGNHDESYSRCHRMGFDVVVDEMRMSLAGERVRVCHYPPIRGSDQRFRERRPRLHKGEWLIHGHDHEAPRKQGRCINVAVDAWDFRPVHRTEVEALIRGEA